MHFSFEEAGERVIFGTKMLSAATLALVVAMAVQGEAPKAEGTLKTRWAAKVGSLPHPEYPRPQMARKNWVNLNGIWDLQILNKDRREVWKGKILVPFPVESQLSRVQRRVPEGGTLVYRRTFSRPTGERVLLNFGAVDWHSKVSVNGRAVGEHRGGYDPFFFDITHGLKSSGNELRVEVQDPTDLGSQPRGKQVTKPGGIFYTPISGIWQTVWLEAVPRHSIAGLDVLGETDGTLRVGIDTLTAPGAPKLRSYFTVEMRDGGRTYKATAVAGGEAVLNIPKPRLWAPGSPNLYPIKVKWAQDEVTSYVAFRDVRIGKAKDGKTRILLNGKATFLAGPLDQGFWPDGLYTAPTEEALRYDIEMTKRLGFNTIRKHVKVEPARWYYLCDKLGIAVLQDMPSMSGFIGGDDPDLKLPEAVQNQFLREHSEMIHSLRNHPSILMWVPFNEGWGQHETARVVNFVKALDPSRLVNNASGWTDRAVGDVYDIHVYPGPSSPQPEPKRAAVLGEFGGLGLPVEGHTWRASGWGYQSFKTKQELTDRFVGIFDQLRFLIGEPGLSCAIYTQTTDVETEINGLLTYDRAVLKMDEKRVREAVLKLYETPPTIREVVPSSQKAGQTWFYRTNNQDGWKLGLAGFGRAGTPGALIRTEWTTPEIWIRREFEITKPLRARLWIHHDEDAEIFLDGNLVRRLTGYTTGYVLDTRELRLTPGKHTLLIHCKQTSGGQYIDAGLVEIVER